jgi:methenyltetrahydrofolate cyclohydrolase
VQQPASVWKSTLEEFDNQITQGQGITGGVAIAAISASFAVSLLRMVIGITARKTDPEGDLAQLQQLRDAAMDESAHLQKAADQDRAAYASYVEALRLPRATDQERAARDQATRRALEHATETPMGAARSLVRSIELCARAAPLVRGDVAADVTGAAEILEGALRAILASVDVNLRRIGDEEIRKERLELEAEADRYADQVRSRLRG